MTAAQEPVVIAGLSGMQLIGRGGFSTVYRARQDRLGRDVAVKVLHVDMTDAGAREQFLNECAAAGRMADHPNIVTVYDSGFTTAGAPYLVMEYCAQASLADRLRGGPLDLDMALMVLIKLSAALATAHQAGVLHRDIKPENVLFTNYGEPALTDFGIAALTSGAQKSFTVAALTPNHAAPEVLDGGRAAAASDVYSLASTAYQVLSGVPPFQRERDEGLLSFFGRIVSQRAPELARPDAPRELADAIARGLAKTPAERFPTVEKFGEALRHAQRTAGYAPTDLHVGVAKHGPAADAPPLASLPATTIAAVPSSASEAPTPSDPGRQTGDGTLIPPPPPPTTSAQGQGTATILRPGGAAQAAIAPVTRPGQPPERVRRRWLMPALIGGAVLALVCGVGGYAGYHQLADRQVAGGVSPSGSPVRTPAAVTSAPASTGATPSATLSQSSAATATSTPSQTNQANSGPTTPSGPRVDYVKIKQKPQCPSGTTQAQFPAVPLILEWKVSGGATGSELDVDGPGAYMTYDGTHTQETLYFSCGGAPGSTETHTYRIVTVGGGSKQSKTITVSAVVNEITQA